MKYNGNVTISQPEKSIGEAVISIEKEGVFLGPHFIDYAEVSGLRPINHRVYIDLNDQNTIEISMLGFSYDGFWEDLIRHFGNRSEASLFIEEPLIMKCEGEYDLPLENSADRESGRGNIALYPDAVCILPQTNKAVRIPLCYTQNIIRDGYKITIQMRSGEHYTVGRMGYDTIPFSDRCIEAAHNTKEKRQNVLSGIVLQAPFVQKGLFRTADEAAYWQAVYSKRNCAVELFTNEQTATYLYHCEDRERFSQALEEAMEAAGTHRELIYLDEEKLAENSLYRMCMHRSPAIRLLRAASAGRIIHGPSYSSRLADFLEMDCHYLSRLQSE